MTMYFVWSCLLRQCLDDDEPNVILFLVYLLMYISSPEPSPHAVFPALMKYDAFVCLITLIKVTGQTSSEGAPIRYLLQKTRADRSHLSYPALCLLLP